MFSFKFKSPDKSKSPEEAGPTMEQLEKETKPSRDYLNSFFGYSELPSTGVEVNFSTLDTTSKKRDSLNTFDFAEPESSRDSALLLMRTMADARSQGAFPDFKEYEQKQFRLLVSAVLDGADLQAIKSALMYREPKETIPSNSTPEEISSQHLAARANLNTSFYMMMIHLKAAHINHPNVKKVLRLWNWEIKMDYFKIKMADPEPQNPTDQTMTCSFCRP